MKRESEDGSALVMVLGVSLLILAFIVMYEKWTRQNFKEAVSRNGVQQALLNAQTATDLAKDQLRDPRFWSTFNGAPSWTFGPWTSTTTPSLPLRGWAQTTATRDRTDPALLDLWTTAYFQIATGSTTAVTDTNVRVHSIGDFFAAVPTSLQISPGTDLTKGTVYARDLIFLPATGPLTKITQAYYFNSVTIAPNSVQFLNLPSTGPIRVPYEPNLIAIDTATFHNLYAAWVNPADILGASFTSGAPPTNSYGVYLAPGNLDVGPSNGLLSVSNPIVIYCDGNITIHSNITVSPGTPGWLAIIAAGDIILASDVPSTAILQATLVSNGAIYAQKKGGSSLAFSGGFDAAGGANVGGGWAARTYVYVRPPPGILLPYLITTESYHIVQGKYSQ